MIEAGEWSLGTRLHRLATTILGDCRTSWGEPVSECICTSRYVMTASKMSNKTKGARLLAS